MRRISMAIVVFLVLSVVACGGNDQTDQATQNQNSNINNSADAGRLEEDSDTDVVWNEQEVDEMPMPVYNRPQAVSVDDYVEIKHDGEVYLQMVIDTHGFIDTVFVEESSGHSYLDTLALNSVRDMVFTPATKGGIPVKVRTTQGFIYRIPPESFLDSPTPTWESTNTAGDSNVELQRHGQPD